MSTNAWSRAIATAQAWNSAPSHQLVVKLVSGQSLVRTHLMWGFGGTTSTRVAPTSVMGDIAALGVVTTIGPGTETPPDPVDTPDNVSPPSQRWVFFSVKAPCCVTWDAANSVAVWQSSPAEQRGDSEGQVLAPSGMGTGNTLNVWVSWNTLVNWDSSGAAVAWWAVSCLVRSP